MPYGLQDTSLISMTQHLDMLRAIAGRTRLPIVADIDAGYGNAISVIHTITEYERAGANAVVIGEAAITARSDPDFLVIARTEALIASLGEAEALRPARAEAGADMILIHSKMTNPSEIESFSRAWTGAVPLVVVPNAYPDLDSTAGQNVGQCQHDDLWQLRHPCCCERHAGDVPTDHR